MTFGRGKTVLLRPGGHQRSEVRPQRAGPSCRRHAAFPWGVLRKRGALPWRQNEHKEVTTGAKLGSITPGSCG